MEVAIKKTGIEAGTAVVAGSAGLALMIASFMGGLLSAVCPLLGIVMIMAALSEGHIVLWLVVAMPIAGLIIAIAGFIIRGKGSKVLKKSSLPKGLTLFIRIMCNYLGVAANVLGLLMNVGVIVALIVLRSKLEMLGI